MRIIFTLALVAGLSLLSGTPDPTAPTPAESRVEVIVAFVTADFDEEANLVGVTLETEEGLVYAVELDQKGRNLGETMDGEWIEAEGLVMERDGTLWMTVRRAARFTDDEEGYYDEEPGPSPDEGWEGEERWDDPDHQTDEDDGERREEEEALEEDEGNGEWEDDGGNGRDDEDWDEADDQAEYEDTDLP